MGKYHIFEKKGDLGYLTLNRPDVLNVFNRGMLEELQELFTDTLKDEPIKALIINGAGRAFCAGADIEEMWELDRVKSMEFSEQGQKIMNALENLPFLTIAAVHGYALGGGLELALACDFIYSARTATFGLPEATLGLIPGFGGTQRLPRLVGITKAKELIMSGRKLPADEAFALGIVYHLCEPDKLLEDCAIDAQRYCNNPYFAIMQAKKAINEGYQLPFDQALELECSLFSKCIQNKESHQRIAAFKCKK